MIQTLRLPTYPLVRRIQRAADPGFTLIELLVVLTIIGLIVGLVGPRVLGYLAESRTKTAKLQIESFSASLDLFYLDTGRYPTTSEGLNALAERPADALGGSQATEQARLLFAAGEQIGEVGKAIPDRCQHGKSVVLAAQMRARA